MGHLEMGPKGADIAAGSTITPTMPPQWAVNEKTVVSVEPSTAVGSMDVSVKFLNGSTWFSMGTIDLTAAVPMEIESIGITDVQLTPTGLTGTWDYQIFGKDQ